MRIATQIISREIEKLFIPTVMEIVELMMMIAVAAGKYLPPLASRYKAFLY